MSRSLGKRVAVTLRMPTVLRDRLAALAEAEGVSLNEWMSVHLAQELGAESYPTAGYLLGIEPEIIRRSCLTP